jgi:DNA-binding CsgD family transcriptional regulator
MRHLTPQEQRVYELLLTNLTICEIAQNLFVSARTIETHAGTIYGKLQARGRIDLLSRELAKVGGVPSGCSPIQARFGDVQAESSLVEALKRLEAAVLRLEALALKFSSICQQQIEHNEH